MDTYKTLSAYLGYAVWQISKPLLNEFCASCPGLIDKETGTGKYGMNLVYLQETAIKNSQIDKDERTKNKNKNLPDNIVRHQFMGLLVKIARDRHLTTSIYYYKNILFFRKNFSYC